MVIAAEAAGIALLFLVPFWGCVWLRDRRHLAYVDYPVEFAMYFLLCSLVGIWLFRAELARAPVNTLVAIPAVILVLTLVVTVGIYAAGKKRIPDGAQHFAQYGHAHNKWVSLDYRYLVPKSFEVLYQQVALVLVVLVLRTMLPSLLEFALLFAGLFGLLHFVMYLFWYRKKRVPASSVMLFSAFSFLGGLVMPVFILQVPFGFVYSFCVHVLYYPMIGVGFRYYLVKSDKGPPNRFSEDAGTWSES